MYLWALMPSTVLAAESLVLAEETSSIIPTLMQGGIGGLVGLVAVKMLLVLYQDKEKNSNEFHTKLLEVIESQIKVNQELISSNKDVVQTMTEIRDKVLENRTLFLAHMKHEEK